MESEGLVNLNNSYKNKDNDKNKILTLSFVTLYILLSCINATTYMVNTIFSDFSTVIIGTTIGMAGTVAGMTNIGALIIAPFCGPANNRLDRRKLLQAAMLILALTTIGYTCCKSIPLLLILRLISGFGYGLSLTTSIVTATDVLPENRITEGIGYLNISNILMEAIGPSLAVFLSYRFSYAAAFITAAIICLFGFLLAFKLLPPVPVIKEVPEEKKLTISVFIKELFAKEALLPTTIGALFALISGIQQVFLVPYAKSFGLAESAGLYFTLLACAMFASRLLLGKFVQKRTIAFAVIFSGVFLISCPILLGFGKSIVTLLLAGISFGIGYGTLIPVTQSTSVKFLPPERRGSGSSTYITGIRLAYAVGSVSGGLLAQNFGYARMFLFLVIPSLLAITLGIIKGRVPINPEPETKDEAKSL